MIIACPACNTRYVVPDSAIGVDGRTVRCAKCKHSWFQDGPSAERVAASEAVPVQAPAPAPVQAPAPRHAPVPVPAGSAAGPDFSYSGNAPASVSETAPQARETVPTAAPAIEDGPDFDETPPPSYGAEELSQPQPAADIDEDELVSRFDHSPPFRPRRNMLKLWTWAAAIFAVLAAGALFAMQRYGTPDWWPMEKPLFGAAQPDLELAFPAEAQSWRELENKTYLFSARIEVTNTARESRKLPPVLIVMRDQRERQVYSWVVQPPQATLAPGESVTIDEARTDVPRSAVFADVGWAPL